MSERAASQPPPPSLPLEELAHSDEAYILLLVRRGLLLPDTTKTWHFNLLPVTSLVPLGGFSRAPSYHLLVGKNTFRKSCSLALLLQEGQEKQEERRSSGRRLWLRTEQATSPAKPSNGGGGVPSTFLVPFKLLPQTSGSYHCCPGADRGQGFLLQLFSTGAAFKRKRVRAPGDHKGRWHCYLNRLRTATLAYFYPLADQHTSFSEGFYSNANKSQARWGEHDASPSFPKTQARPSTQKGSVLWGWLHSTSPNKQFRTALDLTLEVTLGMSVDMTDDSSVLCIVRGQTTKTES